MRGACEKRRSSDRRRPVRIGGIARAVAATCAAFAIGAASPSTAGPRDDEPVVLTGSDLPILRGAAPDRVVGFRYDAGWVAIPVQIDERAVVDFAQIYNRPVSGSTHLMYTDPDTFTGADPVATFDDDDELVFLAGEAGGLAPIGAPANVVAGTRTRVSLDDPVGGGTTHVYLFVSDGSLDPGAGRTPIENAFDLLSGDYKTTYKTLAGPNPEDTWIRTPVYEVHFSDRWVKDGMRVVAGNASGDDVLDRNRFVFSPRVCARSEDTFVQGEGAFIVNRSGPVRALRGYIGANSGPTSFRVHHFYERRETTVAHVRVHEIPGTLDVFDYETTATGMTYSNEANPDGVAIDGVPDALAAAERVAWELVDGPHGAWASRYEYDTDLPSLDTSVYRNDELAPETPPCTGDDADFGSHGMRTGRVLNTDPQMEPVYRLIVRRTFRFGEPGVGRGFAEEFATSIDRPLAATVVGEGGGGGGCDDADGDGFEDAVCNEDPGSGGGDCDDGDDTRFPGATETCNALDDDCDDAVDEGLPTTTYWTDLDGDGHGDASSPVDRCEATAPDGLSDDDGDCDDTRADVAPGAPEVCNDGVDNDCDSLTDGEDGDCPSECADTDGDGFPDASCDPGGSTTGTDCDDGDPAIFPGAPELCDAIDSDCNGVVDDPRCEDYEVDDNGRIDGVELAWVGRSFGLCSATPDLEWWREVDYNRDGCVDGDDLAMLGNLWALPCVGELLVCD